MLAVTLLNSSVTGFAAEPKRPFLAVWCTPYFDQFWVHLKPDYIQVAYDWDNFDSFLDDVAKKAGNRPIDLDIDVHGLEHLTLQYVDYRTEQWVSKRATFGYLINHIEKHLRGRNVTLLVESCYGGHVYKHTIRNNKPEPGVKVEDCNHVPSFPVYGGTYGHMGMGNLVYLQYVSGFRYAFNDLRRWEKDPCESIDSDEESPFHQELVQVWNFFKKYYKP